MAKQHAQYLESKVLTAPPQRLHLMLVEGALRFGREAEEALARGEQAAAAVPLVRVIDIVGELVAGVREPKSELNQKLAELYWFVFRRVAEAKIHSDSDALTEALRLLDYERQTWQFVCEKLGDGPQPTSPHRGNVSQSFTPQAPKVGISLEA